MTIQDHNTAVNFQRSMPTEIANLFARALPNDFTNEFNPDAVRAFEKWILQHPDMAEALAFLHTAVSDCLPTGGFKKLCGV